MADSGELDGPQLIGPDLDAAADAYVTPDVCIALFNPYEPDSGPMCTTSAECCQLTVPRAAGLLPIRPVRSGPPAVDPAASVITAGPRGRSRSMRRGADGRCSTAKPAHPRDEGDHPRAPSGAVAGAEDPGAPLVRRPTSRPFDVVTGRHM